MADVPDEVLDELYGAPLAEFTPLRDARAKELRSGGDRATADAVKKLRKPSVSAWAVNQLSRRAADGVSGLLAAGEALRQAQLGGGGDATAVRSSARDEREAVEELVREAAAALREAGRGASDSTLEEVRGTLHAAAVDEGVRALVSSGRLTEAVQAIGLGGGFVVPGKTASGEGGGGAKRARSAAKPAVVDESETKAAKAEAEKRAAKEARERQKAARAALKDAEKAARERSRALQAAQRERDRAAEALARAETDLERAERDAGEADDLVERRRTELEEAGG